MRRTITRTHPNRSRGKSRRTSAATRTTTRLSSTRWLLLSRWSSRGTSTPSLDLVSVSVSGRDGPPSGDRTVGGTSAAAVSCSGPFRCFWTFLPSYCPTTAFRAIVGLKIYILNWGANIQNKNILLRLKC